MSVFWEMTGVDASLRIALRQSIEGGLLLGRQILRKIYTQKYARLDIRATFALTGVAVFLMQLVRSR